MTTHDHVSRAHQALLRLHAQTDREGARLVQAQRSGSVSTAVRWIRGSRGTRTRSRSICYVVRRAARRRPARRGDRAAREPARRSRGRMAADDQGPDTLAQGSALVAWSYAREGYFRGDAARAVEGFGRVEPADDVDVAMFLDSLVAIGREDEVSLAWAQFGLGAGHDRPGRAARGGAGAARGGRVAARARGAVARRARRAAARRARRDRAVRPALVGGADRDARGRARAIASRSGRATLARRMARDIADFVPAARRRARSCRARSAEGDAARARSRPRSRASRPSTPSKRAIDALFARARCAAQGRRMRLADGARGDRLVNRWLEVVFTEASEEDPVALAHAAAYARAQARRALPRRDHAAREPDRGRAAHRRRRGARARPHVIARRSAIASARALLGVIDPLLRRVDRWIGSTWLDTVERACAIDERAAGDVAGFAREHATVAARILGPEESAVLAASIARAASRSPGGVGGAVAAQAARLAAHTGYVGADEWAEAIVAQLAASEIEVDDAIDALHTACYLVEGVSAGPSRPCRARAARCRPCARPRSPCCPPASVRRAPRGAIAQLATLADAWSRITLDVPLAFDKVATGMFEALQKGELRARREARSVGRRARSRQRRGAPQPRPRVRAAGQGPRGAAPPRPRHARAGDADPLGRALPERQAARGDGRARLREPVVRPRGAVADLRRHRVRRDGQPAHRQGLRARLPARSGRVRYHPAQRVRRRARRGRRLRDLRGDREPPAARRGRRHRCGRPTGGITSRAPASATASSTRRSSSPSARSSRTRSPTTPRASRRRSTRAQARVAPTPPPAATPGRPREPVFTLLEAGDLAAAAGARHRSELARAPRRARGHAVPVLVGERRRRHAACPRRGDRRARRHRRHLDREARARPRRSRCRSASRRYFARDPVPRLGDRMTRDAFYQEFRARGGVVLGEEAPAPPPFDDRVVVPGEQGVERQRLRRAAPRSRGAAAARRARAVRSRRRRLPRGRRGVGAPRWTAIRRSRARSPPASRSAERRTAVAPRV